MRFLQQNRFTLVFIVALFVCSVMVVRQVIANQAKHIELRESFVLLNAKGHAPQAQQLYERLVRELEAASIKTLLEDFQRVSPMVDPARQQPENLLWKYYWSLSNELEKRAQSTLVRALQLAEEER